MTCSSSSQSFNDPEGVHCVLPLGEPGAESLGLTHSALSVAQRDGTFYSTEMCWTFPCDRQLASELGLALAVDFMA